MKKNPIPRYTTLRTKLPPKEARDRFKALVVIQETFYNFELSAAFTQAISDQEATLPAHQAHAQARGNPGAAGRILVPREPNLITALPLSGVGGIGPP